MKICVIIANDKWRATAGVRIRYNRLQPVLERLGHTLELKAISDFSSVKGENSDVYVFSKTHDVRAPILARLLRAKGSRVGVDLFDDYYSQGTDSRFVHLRRWFRTMLPVLDFAMCATPKMAERLKGLAPGLPCQIVNDPFGTLDAEKMAGDIAANAAQARADKILRIGWFGIGDNPHFTLGLDDLYAFSDALSGAQNLGYDVVLEILTNTRALTAQRMQMLARLPVPFTLDEWTEERETALIGRSLACFLPVNAQGFSVVKSLNRGVSTLTAGSQILSAGFPLYNLLDKFVYRDIASLVADLEADQLRLRGDTIADLEELMARYGSAEIETEKLIAFLEEIPVPPVRDWPGTNDTMAVVHGSNPVGDIHKAIQKLGFLSVAAPQTRRTLNFDVTLLPESDEQTIQVLLSENAWAQLREELRDHLEETTKGNGKGLVYRLAIPADRLPGWEPATPADVPIRSLIETARFAPQMGIIHGLLGLLFSEPQVFLAENQSPYWGPSNAEPQMPNKHVADAPLNSAPTIGTI